MTPRLIAEWEPQDAIFITWPHEKSDWKDNLKESENTYLQLLAMICDDQDAIICAHDETVKDKILYYIDIHELPKHKIHIFIAPINDTWARDHGPLSVEYLGEPKLINFTFNGWGEKYESSLDNAINTHLKASPIIAKNKMQTESFVLEGGSVETDGRGTLLSTESCLLAPTRNPKFTKRKIEAYLKATLSLDHFLWLTHGALDGDDTDSHIDTLARFCNPETICYVNCNDKTDSHYASLFLMEQELKQFRQPNGKPYTLIPLPLPHPKFDDEGERLPATYANFLITNHSVIFPIYNDDYDDIAIAQITRAFPDRVIKPINCLALIRQFGSLHCVTMQIAKGILNK